MNIRRATLFDLRAVRGILTAARLPAADIAEHFGGFMVGEEGDVAIAAGGLEIHGCVALLRSLAVATAVRGRGIGRNLAEHLIDDARERGISELYLLTTTAERFFARLGFETIDRKATPPAIRDSREFSTLCGDSAVLMRRILS